jgi:hypothetical protein
MTITQHDDAHGGMDDPALDALLRRVDVATHLAASAHLESRILAHAELPLAARRRDARVGASPSRRSTADTLAAWFRIALPTAAAAAIIAALSLSRIDVTVVADADLQSSDPAALLSALDNNANDLAHHLIASDAGDDDAMTTESR